MRWNFFNQLSIKNRLIAIGGIIAFFFLILLILSYVYNRKLMKYSDSRNLVKNLYEKTVSILNTHQDFLLTDRFEQEFYSSQQTKNILKIKTLFENSDNIIDSLKKNYISDKNLQILLDSVKVDLSITQTTLDELVTHTKERGFDKYGLSGVLQTSALELDELGEKTNNEQISNLIADLQIIEKKYLITKDTIYKEQFNSLSKLIESQIYQFTSTIIDTAGTTRITDVKALRLANAIDRYNKLMNKLVETDILIGIDNESGLIGRFNYRLEKINGSVTKLISSVEKSGTNENSVFMVILYLSAFVVIVLSVMIVAKVSKEMVDSIEKLRKYLYRLSLGELPERIEMKNKDELSEMSDEINILTENLKNTREFSIAVGKGNFDKEINVFNNQGDLGEALLQMREELIKVAKEREKQIEDEKQRNWAATGIAEFNDIFRQHSGNLLELSESVIQKLVSYVNAVQGALFILNDDNTQDIYLELIASYAFGRKKFLDKKIALGDDLIGTCALEKKTIYINEIPDNYIEIRSGLGGSAPSYLLLVPMRLENIIFGVFELASFRPFRQHEIEFTEKIGETISSTMQTVRINQRTADLLEKSRIQTEELASKEEEMRQNMEELQATQEEMSRKNDELQKQSVEEANRLVQQMENHQIALENKEMEMQAEIEKLKQMHRFQLDDLNELLKETKTTISNYEIKINEKNDIIDQLKSDIKKIRDVYENK